MDKDKIIEYIMTTPQNVNWAVLKSILGEGNWENLEKYVKHTPLNMNRMVLEGFFESGSSNSAIVGEAIVGSAVI